MKKFFFSGIETFAIGGLMIGAILSLISFVSLCLYVFADVKPYIVTDSFFIGATQFEKGLPVPVKLSYQFPPTDLRRDTSGIRTRYEHWPADPDYYIDGASINEGIVYVHTERMLRKLEFLFPQLLSLLVAAYCMWQIGILLQSITKQAAFENINFTRLRNVGWAIIVCQLALLATQSQTKAFNLFYC
jgi:hypothetical protein